MCDLCNALGLCSNTDVAGWKCAAGEPSPTSVCPTGSWAGIVCDVNDRVVDISLESSGLTGSLPSSVGALAELTRLVLASNSIGGSIPSGIGNLDKLAVLDIQSNSLTGSLPVSLANLATLTELLVMDNLLTGSLIQLFHTFN